MKKILLLFSISLFFFGSCDEDEFLREEPKDAIYSENLFVDYSGFCASMNSVYGMMRKLYIDSELAGQEGLWVINTDNVSTRDSPINRFEGMSPAWERNSIEDIKEKMKKDLIFAVDNLPLDREDKIRINGAVARHYLGELYLSLCDFQNALDVLKPLCEGSSFSLVKDRFGRVAGNPDGNMFKDVIRSPFTNQGNTETFFVISNGLDIPGSQILNLMENWVGHYRKYSKIQQNAEWHERFGGCGRGRYICTPWSMFNESDYQLYDQYKYLKDPADEHIIDQWLWTNTDGRDNYLYEMDDIRGIETSIRKFFVYDWNANGSLTDTSTYPLSETLYRNDVAFNDDMNEGDSLYTLDIFRPDDMGKPDNADRHTYMYTRKWELDNTTTNDWNKRGNAYLTVGHLRLAESYLLYAEAHLMNGNPGDAAIWINAIRERAGASTISSGDVSIDYILDERSRELIGEEHHKLYPFPSEAIDANKDRILDQNLGWGGSTTVDYTPTGYPDEGINP